MKERPILFSGEMVRAILGGRKSQTRRAIRICDDPIPKSDRVLYQRGIPTNANNVRMSCPYLKCDSPPGSATVSCRVFCPYGTIGDKLWVKETFGIPYALAKGQVAPREDIVYRANPRDQSAPLKWKPAIFMRREYSRITLEITGVRVQRLQDITEDDARAEGCYPVVHGTVDCGTRKTTYRKLWESINRAGSWDENPWVWVIKFQPI